MGDVSTYGYVLAFAVVAIFWVAAIHKVYWVVYRHIFMRDDLTDNDEIYLIEAMIIREGVILFLLGVICLIVTCMS